MRRLVVGFSGGLDSTVLLHAVVQLAPVLGVEIAAVHVHHGLSPQADAWAVHVMQVCDHLSVPLMALRVRVTPTHGSLEEAARAARREAFVGVLQAGDALLLAQHQDDQAETVLFRLMRGAGVRGLAAMQAASELPAASGTVPLWRPLLGLPRSRLLAYAIEHQLEWIEDESNADVRHARNFLRHEALPLLEKRWPSLSATLAQTAKRMQEAEGLLEEMAAEMALVAIDAQQRLDINVLQSFSMPRQRLLLRYWLQQQDFLLPDEALLQKIMDEVVAARTDATPLLAWTGCELRRYREHLYVMSPLLALPEGWQCRWDGCRPLLLPDGRYLYASLPLPPDSVVRFRQGGERLRRAGHEHSASLKRLLQERGIPPWCRDRLPLVFVDEVLYAVAGTDLYANAAGARLSWTPVE
ncbi:MAG: tRNA lysidine(34) synthetase TilS [Moraxellaceae bacterium]|nr:tRNA lysidine(34) synthetase TilS [Moraxellaceae bacterium]